jgi:alcohol dehydrogenase class IV
MSDIFDEISKLRESLSFFADENITDLSDTEIVAAANELIQDLQVKQSLYELAIAHSITGSDFERWSVLAMERLSNMREGDEVSEEDLLELLKHCRS